MKYYYHDKRVVGVDIKIMILKNHSKKLFTAKKFSVFEIENLMSNFIIYYKKTVSKASCSKS